MEDDKQRRAHDDANAAGDTEQGAHEAPTGTEAAAAEPAGEGKRAPTRRGRGAKGSATRPAAPRPIDHVRVADGALRSIIGLAAHEVPGVVGMAPVNIGEGLRRILGARQVDEGVLVEHPRGEGRADVDIHVVVAYGVNIPVVADGVRDRVRYAAKQYAGVELDQVRVHVEGVSRG